MSCFCEDLLILFSSVRVFGVRIWVDVQINESTHMRILSPLDWIFSSISDILLHQLELKIPFSD